MKQGIPPILAITAIMLTLGMSVAPLFNIHIIIRCWILIAMYAVLVLSLIYCSETSLSEYLIIKRGVGKQQRFLSIFIYIVAFVSLYHGITTVGGLLNSEDRNVNSARAELSADGVQYNQPAMENILKIAVYDETNSMIREKMIEVVSSIKAMDQDDSAVEIDKWIYRYKDKSLHDSLHWMLAMYSVAEHHQREEIVNIIYQKLLTAGYSIKESETITTAIRYIEETRIGE